MGMKWRGSVSVAYMKTILEIGYGSWYSMLCSWKEAGLAMMHGDCTNVSMRCYRYCMSINLCWRVRRRYGKRTLLIE
jgi:hypothetical protein